MNLLTSYTFRTRHMWAFRILRYYPKKPSSRLRRAILVLRFCQHLRLPLQIVETSCAQRPKKYSVYEYMLHMKSTYRMRGLISVFTARM